MTSTGTDLAPPAGAEPALLSPQPPSEAPAADGGEGPDRNQVTPDVDAAVARYFASVGRRYGALILGLVVAVLLAVAIPLTRARNPVARLAGSSGAPGSQASAAAAPSASAVVPGAASPDAPAGASEPAAAASIADPLSVGGTASPSGDSGQALGATTGAGGGSSQTGDVGSNPSDQAPDAGATGPPVPLQIVESGWATTDAPGTAAGSAGVPDGDLPVAGRAGQTTKYSFARLRGSDTRLSLTLASDPGANQLDTEAAVEACPVLDPGWKAGPAQSTADGPRVDTAACRVATRNGNVFTFDLTGIDGVGGPAGIAFVPAATAGPAFQIVLAPGG